MLRVSSGKPMKISPSHQLPVQTRADREYQKPWDTLTHTCALPWLLTSPTNTPGPEDPPSSAGLPPGTWLMGTIPTARSFFLVPSTSSATCAEGTTSCLPQSVRNSWRAVPLLPLRRPTRSSQSQPGPCRFCSGSSWQSPQTAQPPAAGLSGPGTPSLWQPGSHRRGDAAAAAAPCPAAVQTWNSQMSPACLQTGIKAHIRYVKTQVYSRGTCMKIYFI